MKLVDINELKGNEKLGKHILTPTGMELMAKGTIVKPEYVAKLKELGIGYVYVDDSMFIDIDFEREEQGIICEKVKQESTNIVKNVMERHIYKNTSDLMKLCEAANIIVDDILGENDILDRVVNIRREGTDIYSHSINVCSLATVLALKNGYDKETVTEIAKGCILHDLGLRYTAVQYENIDMEDMSQKDKSEFKKHVILGFDAIENEPWASQIIKDIVLLHHERFDGSGYPFKRQGKDLDDVVKIVAVCDAFDSMIRGIGYVPKKIHEAVEYIRCNSLGKFARKYSDQLLTMVAMYPVGTKVITSDDKIAVVVKQNKECIDRPVIKILAERSGKELPEETVDMTEVLTIFIVDTLD